MTSYYTALRAAAVTAEQLGDSGAARLLRGYASTLADDHSAVAAKRIRACLAEGLSLSRPGTPIAAVWRGALADMSTAPAAPAPPPTTPPAPPRAPRVAKLPQAVPPAPPGNDVEPAREPAADVASLRKLQRRLAKSESEVARLSLALVAITERVTALEAVGRVGGVAGQVAVQLETRKLPNGCTWLDLVTTIADDHNVRLSTVMGRVRDQAVSHARHEVWWRLVVQHEVPQNEVALVWRRDHSTVDYGVRAHAKRMAARAARASALDKAAA